MQRQIKFIRSGASSVFGGFAPGDTLRCGAEAARHLVEEAGAAVYIDGAAAATEQVAGPTAQPKRRRRTPAAT